MNPYNNTLQKVRGLLKRDDQLTKSQCELFQWQLLVKVPGDYTFTVGKGGVNTIFYSLSSEERAVCYPEDILTLLEGLSRRNVFVYLALGKDKAELGYSIDLEKAKLIKNARRIVAVNFKGKKTLVEKRVPGLFGKKSWQSTVK